MDKKYVADKRAKSKKYKNPKYNKKPEIIERPNVTSELTTSSKRVTVDDDHKTQEIEDVVPPNNWTRYELTNDDDEHCSIQGADYETLLLAPVSIDSHFKFKSEQNWDKDINSQINLSKYFTLNITLLNDGVSCVPFIKRHGYEDSIVSRLELELMKSTSEANLRKYNKLIERKFPTKTDIIVTKHIKPQISDTLFNTEKKEIIPDIKHEIIPSIKHEIVPSIKNEINPSIKNENTKTKTECIIEDDVDELLKLKCADLVIHEPDIKVEDPLLEKIELGKVIPPQPTVDLEQWLDDILGD